VNVDGVWDWLRRRLAPPPDPDLDAFCDAIGALSLDGVVVGYVASRVSGFWGLGRPGGLQQCLWLYFHYLDDPEASPDRHEQWEEDYPPWTLRRELEGGFFHDHDREATYAFSWLEGTARHEAFTVVGLQEPVS